MPSTFAVPFCLELQPLRRYDRKAMQALKSG
jgi:hypothetical protein